MLIGITSSVLYMLIRLVASHSDDVSNDDIESMLHHATPRYV